MAARNRPRGVFVKDDLADAHEERNMWSQIVTDIKRLRANHARAAEVAKMQVDLEAKIGKSPSVGEIDELIDLYREATKLAEDEEKILKDEPNDVIKNIEILVALRSASETEPTRPSTAVNKSRNPKRQKLETDGAAESPAPLPSPSVVLPAARIKGSSSVRSGSVPSTREVKPEVMVKIEEGSEGSKGPAGERAGKFFKGAEVAYKQAKQREDGSQWIQYEVQDPEPDENGAPGQVYKTFAAALIAIPGPDAVLPDFPIGKHVLARYPETTTFYRAEVTGVKKDVYRLRFEDDQDQEMDVGRRFVLDVNSK
ncbi:SAGA-associated factor 29, partial [Lecanoromycetidae sp. Uapishka_2]